MDEINSKYTTHNMNNESKDLYRRITGLNYENDIIAKREIDEIVKYLKETECHVLGLMGKFEKIHSCVYVSELREFKEDDLLDYATLLGFISRINESSNKSNENDIRTTIMTEKYKLLEIMRFYSYVDSVLFGGMTAEKYHFYYFNVDSDIVKMNGIKHYYLQCGEATIEDLVDKYSRFELAIMCGNLSYLLNREYVLKLGDSDRDIASMILSLLDMIDPDPRTILTIMGLQVIHQNFDLNLRIDIREKGKLSDFMKTILKYGISKWTNGDIELNPIELYHKTVLFTLQPKFFMDVPEVSTIEPITNTLGEDIDDAMNVIYYGTGDGVTEYKFFTEEELTNLWLENGFPIDPYNLTLFSNDSIKFLMMNSRTKELSSVIRTMIQENHYEIPIIKELKFTRTDLSFLFNIGVLLSNWEDLSSFSNLDIVMRPTEILRDPRYYRSLRTKIDGILMKGLTLNLEGMFMVDTRRNIPLEQFHFFIDATNPYNSISERLKLLMECNRLSLFETITYNGNLLLYTAEYYHQMKFKEPLASSIVEFVEAPD